MAAIKMYGNCSAMCIRGNNTGIDAARLQYLYPTQYDVGVENNNFMPVSFAQMKIIIEKQVEQLKMKEQ